MASSELKVAELQNQVLQLTKAMDTLLEAVDARIFNLGGAVVEGNKVDMVSGTNVVLDCANAGTFVIDNSTATHVRIINQPTTRSITIHVLVQGKALLTWEDFIGWAGGTPAIDAAWVWLSLIYIPNRGWYGTPMTATVGGGEVVDPSIPPDPAPGNLLDSAYLSSVSSWQSLDGTKITYGQLDPRGQPFAAEVEFVAESGQHVWMPFSTPLTPGNRYLVQVEVKPGSRGYAGQFQVGYYDDTSMVSRFETPLEDGWQIVTGEITATEISSQSPMLRLIGYREASVGESVIIGRVRMVLSHDSSVTAMQRPYNDDEKPWNVGDTSRLRAVHYDRGGQGVSFLDMDLRQEGSSSLRSDGVDIDGDGYNAVISHTEDGEWMEYTVNVIEEGRYGVSARVANPSPEAALSVSAEMDNLTYATSEPKKLPVTGRLDAFAYSDKMYIDLLKGIQVLRLTVEGGGANIDLLEFSKLKQSEVNLIPTDYVDTSWGNVSGSTQFQYGMEDKQGGNNGTAVTLSGPNNHHIWVDLASSLTPGKDYLLRVDVKPGPGGFTGYFGMSYYNGGSYINRRKVNLAGGWQTLEFQFIAGESIADEPTIRLIGWDGGADGDVVVIGKVELNQIVVEASTKVERDAATDPVASGNVATFNYGTPKTFNIEEPGDRGAVVAADAAPGKSTTTFQGYLTNDVAARSSWGEQFTTILPSSLEAPFSSKRLHTVMQAGSSSGSDPGGTEGGTGWEAVLLPPGVETAALRYSVKFQPGFDWVKGGKLPGLFGGNSPSGGADATDGFSTRMMWRKDGKGELYAYLPNKKEPYGDQIGTGLFNFEAGKWHTIEQEIMLNTIGPGGEIYHNGLARIWFDGRPVFEVRNLIFRTKASVTIDGIMSTIFFGGTGPDWRTPVDQWIETGGFYIWAPTESAKG